jgi:hypothetical protein
VFLFNLEMYSRMQLKVGRNDEELVFFSVRISQGQHNAFVNLIPSKNHLWNHIRTLRTTNPQKPEVAKK